MIALPRTRDFFASNWQILLAKKQPECGPLIVEYMALTFFGAESLGSPFHAEPDKTARGVVQGATGTMNKQISGMEQLILCGKETNC